MDNNKFNIHAKNLLDGLETPVNVDALWDNVHTELYPEKKKKFGWVWFSASSILAVLLFSGYVYMSNTTPSEQNVALNDKVNHKTKTTSDNEVVKLMTPTLAPSESNTNTIEFDNEAQLKKSSISKKKVTRQQATKNKINTSVAKLSANKIVKKNLDITQKIIQSNNQPVNNSYQATPKSNIKQIQKIKIDGPQKSKAENLKTKTEGLQKSEVPIETKADISNIKIIDDETKKLIIAAEKEIDEKLEEPALDMSEEDEDDGENFGRKFKRSFQFGVGFRAGISNSLTTLSAKSEDDVQLRILRSQSERNLETIDLGIDALIKHKSGIYLSAGVDYLKATRKLEFNSEIVVTDSIPGISAIFVNPITMDTTFEQGLIEQTTTSTKTKEVYNNLHVINIPLNLGVSFDYEQWTFGVQGGASLNVYVKQKGQIRDSNDSFYDIGDDNSNWFKDNLDVSYQGAALIGYNFTDNFQIIGGPSVRSTIILSEDVNPIKQSQVGLGLQVNARYWFD